MTIQTVVFTHCPDHGNETMHHIRPQADGSMHLQCIRATGTRPTTQDEAHALRLHGCNLFNMAQLAHIEHRAAGRQQDVLL